MFQLETPNIGIKTLDICSKGHRTEQSSPKVNQGH